MAKTIIISEAEEKRIRECEDGISQSEVYVLLRELDLTRIRLEEFRRSEKKLGEAYLRIRAKLNAWQTLESPTTEEIYTHTEAKLINLINSFKRHGSVEAFQYAGVIDDSPTGDELKARITAARVALLEIGESI